MDARNYFDDTSLPKRAVALEQYGATVGGPLKKDKLFFFLGYSRRKSYSVGNCVLRTSPKMFHKCLEQGRPIPRTVSWTLSKV